MKQFIVLLAVFPLMMAFILQFSAQQITDSRIQMINAEYENAKSKAMIEGIYDDALVEQLRNSLADISGCNQDEVSIDVSSDIKYRTGQFDSREMIYCRIAVPVGNITAMPGLFGISDEENSIVYVVENEFPSERLM